MKLTLKMKISIVMVLAVLVVGGVSLLTNSQAVNDVIDRSYASHVRSLAGTIGAVMDTDQVIRLRDAVMSIYEQSEKLTTERQYAPTYNTYARLYDPVKEMEEYKGIREMLRRMDAANDMESSSLVVLDTENRTMVHLLDSSWRTTLHPGLSEPLSPANQGILTNPAGSVFVYTIHTLQGEKKIAAAPIQEKNGQVAAYLCVEMPMGSIHHQQNRFLLISALIVLAAVCLTAFIGNRMVQHSVVKPIARLVEACKLYFDQDKMNGSHAFHDVDIHTGDEIEELAHSLNRMETSMQDYIHEITETSRKLHDERMRADEMDREASIDTLTRVRNKRAFEEAMSHLNRLAESGNTAFGLCMVDMNNLKVINDTLGHEKGDEAIRTVCGMACSVYKHSPVFRIGGDEFSIVLEKHDYEHAEELRRHFLEVTEERRDDSRPEWEQITAAIGYALFDPATDRNAEDVLKRADRIMYEHKKAMKAKMRDLPRR